MLEDVVTYLSRPEIWVAFVTLSLLEIVLGIDNVIFISIVANRLREPARGRARSLGLLLALIMRVAFLASIVWLVGLTKPIFTYGAFELSWRDVVLGAGGLFLLYKAIVEISAELKGAEPTTHGSAATAFGLVVVQIVLLDLVFSIDSIITAVGLSRQLPVMIAAVVVAILVMLLASGSVGNFIHRHPTVKMLALAFLLLVGFALVADAVHIHINRIYLYVAIAFSFIVELLSLALLRGERRLAPLIFVLCVAILAVADVMSRSAQMDIPPTYFYVPAVFGLCVQILNVLARRARPRPETL